MEKYEVHIYSGAVKTEYKIKGYLKIVDPFYQFTDESGKIIGLFPIKKSVIIENKLW